MNERPDDVTEATGDTDAGEIAVSDNPAESRYEARLGDRLVGIAEYKLDVDPRRIVFVHTEVDRTVKGKGIGSALARGALDDVRSRDLAVTVHCPFITAWLRRHPEYGPARRRAG